MSRDFTIVPQDYIVHHIKTDDMLVHTKDGDYAYHVKTERIPLIRCGDCRYYRADDYSGVFHCFFSSNAVTADDFCSYGERKDDDDQFNSEINSNFMRSNAVNR